MSTLEEALEANREAVRGLVAAGERSGARWSVPRAEGKWSPAQVTEHVALSLEESANLVAGRPSKFPKLPFPPSTPRPRPPLTPGNPDR